MRRGPGGRTSMYHGHHGAPAPLPVGTTGTLPIPTPIPVPVVPLQPVFFEDFLGGPGQVSHVWGNTAAVSYTQTTVKSKRCFETLGAGA